MKKLVCIALTAVMTAALTVGCGDKNDSSESGNNMVGADMDDYANISLEDMPYGSNMCELSPNADENITYKICFDNRYFSEDSMEEIYKVHDFVAAVNENDVEKMKSLYYRDYLDFVCKNNGMTDGDEYFNILYSSAEKYLGEGFSIDYICISDCLDVSDEKASVYFNDTEKNLVEFDSDAAGKVTSRKLVEIGGDTYFSTDEGSYQFTNHMNPMYLALYEIDGEIYIF